MRLDSRSVFQVSRRSFFRSAGTVTAAGLATEAVDFAKASAAAGSQNVYTRIGVKPFINLTATITISGGTLTLPEVKKAMEEASHYSVNIDELIVKPTDQASFTKIVRRPGK